jgi:hypothetical protein
MENDLSGYSWLSDHGADPLANPPDEAGWTDPAARRHFTVFAETWARPLIANRASAAMWALSLILQQQADYWDSFPVTNSLLARASLTPRWKKTILTQLEKLGLIRIEWRGHQSPMVTPLLLRTSRMHKRWRGDR